VPLIKKIHLHTPLSQLWRSDRAKIISGSFVACRRPKAHIVLVDDIVTTGATSSEIARVLLEAGAERVSLLTLARVEF
jgi:predicted amidophosphoribosyltransferase